MNIRELDEESRRTGVWPPRRIILRVDREEEGPETPAETRPAPVKVAEVDLTAPRASTAPPKPKPAPAPLAASLSPSVTPSRRPGLPGSRGVTPAPAVSPEDAEFEKWIAQPLPDAGSEPEFQPPPAWLPDDVRVRAERRHRRVARKARTQLFGASAATTLAVGGCAALLAVVGLSQTESVGGRVGAPNIGLFGARPEPPKPAETADRAPAKPEAKQKPARSESRRGAARRERRATPAPAPRRAGNDSSRSSSPARSSAPSASRAPVRRAANPPPAPPRAPSPPPPPAQQRVSPPPPPPPATQPQSAVFTAPSQPAGGNTAPSRPAGSSRPAPTTSSPAP